MGVDEYPLLTQCPEVVPRPVHTDKLEQDHLDRECCPTHWKPIAFSEDVVIDGVLKKRNFHGNMLRIQQYTLSLFRLKHFAPEQKNCTTRKE